MEVITRDRCGRFFCPDAEGVKGKTKLVAFCLLTVRQVFLLGAALVAHMLITGDWI